MSENAIFPIIIIIVDLFFAIIIIIIIIFIIMLLFFFVGDEYWTRRGVMKIIESHPLLFRACLSVNSH